MRRFRGLVQLGLLAGVLAIGCSSSKDGEKGTLADDVQKACDTIVNQCGAAANGFSMDECVEKMNENSVACAQCVLDLNDPCTMNGAEPNYVSVCHDGSGGCDLK